MRHLRPLSVSPIPRCTIPCSRHLESPQCAPSAQPEAWRLDSLQGCLPFQSQGPEMSIKLVSLCQSIPDSESSGARLRVSSFRIPG